MNKKFIFYLSILSFIIIPVVSWHPTGHFVVARIAEILIEKENPALMPKIKKLLHDLGRFTKEKDHAFVECSCFPDDIKYLDWKSFNKWHFYDDYIFGKDASKEERDKLFRSKQNIVWAIN